MFKNIFLVNLVIFACAMAPAAFAGKMELTTYYPSPYGEYENITSHRLTLGIAPGTAVATPAGILTFVGQAGVPSESTVPKNSTILSGSIFYDSGTGQFKYKNDKNEWECLSKPKLGNGSNSVSPGVAYAGDSSYRANTDGFVLAYVWCDMNGGFLGGNTDSNNPPTTIVAMVGHGSNFLYDYRRLMFPVKRGHYWKVTFSGTASPTIRWIPLE